jgi:PAS domain-containing protein
MPDPHEPSMMADPTHEASVAPGPSARTPAFVVDRLRRIRWANPPFARLMGMTEASLVGATFGEAIGCINAIVERAPCGQTTRCGYCLLEQALERGLVERESQGPVQMVRTVTIRGAPVERSFEFVLSPVLRDGEWMVHVSLPDAPGRRAAPARSR